MLRLFGSVRLSFGAIASMVAWMCLRGELAREGFELCSGLCYVCSEGCVILLPRLGQAVVPFSSRKVAVLMLVLRAAKRCETESKRGKIYF